MSKAILRYAVLTLLLGLSAGFSLNAMQDESPKISPYMLFTYLKNTDSQRILQVRMTNITRTSEVPLPGLTVSFLNNEVVLGEAVTSVSGNAELIIKPDYPLIQGEDGSWTFIARFEGDSLTEATVGELAITDVNLEMKITEEDGKKMVLLKATQSSATGPVPVAGEEISVFVPRTFSLLPVGTGTLEADGTVQIPFPDDIPGDKDGTLTVIGRFNDHYLFGNVEKREETHWGVPVEKAPPAYRSLWSTLAPRWMIVTLSIMLLGVWGHYTFVVISLFRIRKDGLKHKKSE
jgi:hypothetical protein